MCSAAKTMQGYQVPRKAGWDTHGLPVELGVEKALGITKEDIGKKISVDEYNATCRKEVMKYTREWEDLTHRMGYWVDMKNPYITYKNSYIESLWWLLKQLYNKGQGPAVQGLHHPALLARCRYRTELARAEPAGLLPRREGPDGDRTVHRAERRRAPRHQEDP